MMRKILPFFLSVFMFVNFAYGGDFNWNSKFIPPPTDRNFSIVAAFDWVTLAEISPAAYNLELSAHYVKPAFVLDISYEKGLQDWARNLFIDQDKFLALDKFTEKLEVNASITYRSKESKKGALFYRGKTYVAGNEYENYTYGDGDAALYKQLRIGMSKRLFTYMSEGFPLNPILSTGGVNNFLNYSYPDIDLVSTFSNYCYHIGLGSTKVYSTLSPGSSSGSDRIGMVRFYADLLYSPEINYSFLNEDGNAPFVGYVPDQIFQKIGFRLGTETNRLNAFSGYWAFEIGVMPGLRPVNAVTKDQFLFYISLKFGLETGWPLFNSEYE